MEDSISNENIAPKRKAASELCADEEQEVKKICAISRVVTDQPQSSGGKETEVGQEKSEETAKASEDTAKGRPSTPKTPEGVLDVPMFLGLEDGARLAILWDLDGEGEGEKIRKWWGGTLLPYDGRTHAMTDDETGDNATCALRVIDYDEAPELGYAERTLSEVAFLGDHLVYDLSEDNTTCYKREGESWEPSDVDLEEEPAEVLGAVGEITKVSNLLVIRRIMLTTPPPPQSATATSTPVTWKSLSTASSCPSSRRCSLCTQAAPPTNRGSSRKLTSRARRRSSKS
jgi:hypothetical protein